MMRCPSRDLHISLVFMNRPFRFLLFSLLFLSATLALSSLHLTPYRASYLDHSTLQPPKGISTMKLSTKNGAQELDLENRPLIQYS